MYIVDSLLWVFPFGKHENRILINAIREDPSGVSDGILDIHGKIVLKGVMTQAQGDILSYLNWAEREDIIKISDSLWEEIRRYDRAISWINGYKNGSNKVSEKEYFEQIKIKDNLELKYK